MRRILIFTILAGLFLTAMANAQQLSPQPVTPGQWIKSWLLCGPIPIKEPLDASGSWNHLVDFNTDYLIKAGGEHNLQVKEGDVVKYAKGSARWKLYHSPDSIIDLDKALSKDAPVFAYAYTEVQSDESRI
ncbi:MAG: hypothetical protein NTV01_11630, partial [Bacteroidia bacterium]|nr:hypothetical protein [Bacteroidia bacterium]